MCSSTYPDFTFPISSLRSIQGFVDSILDLTVRDDRFNATVVDRFGKDEVIFLGPDEQVIPADIDWIIQRAAVRGYGLPAAFMSSKKGIFTGNYLL